MVLLQAKHLPVKEREASETVGGTSTSQRECILSPKCRSFIAMIDVAYTEDVTYAPQNGQLFVFLSRPGTGVALQPHCVP